jgi:protein-disulfide isomerase
MSYKKWLPYSVTALAIMATVFLVLVFMAFNTARLGGIFTGQTVNTTASNLANTTYDDPLITYVPEGARSSEQKTKVFVSADDPMIGYDTASVYVILYGSLLDSDMQTYLAAIEDVQAQYGDSVAVVWKDYVTDDTAKQAAEVGQCANRQGKFWEYVVALVDSDATNLAGFTQVAIAQGSDQLTLQDCLDHAGMSAKVDVSVGLASPLGVTSTHAVFVNDQTFNDVMTVDELKQTVDETVTSY